MPNWGSHGTLGRYRRGCHCGPCREAGRAGQRCYRATGSTAGWRGYLDGAYVDRRFWRQDAELELLRDYPVLAR